MFILESGIKRSAVEGICESCKNSFIYSLRKVRKYCSQECSNKSRKKLWKCKECNEEILGREARKRKFCSRKCSADNRYSLFIERWLKEEENGKKGESVSNHIRRWLFEKNDSKCQKCGWKVINLVTGNIPLTINHIDGNWSNNKPDNLELICPNCHSLTPNYGALNKGKGRPSRRTNNNL